MQNSKSAILYLITPSIVWKWSESESHSVVSDSLWPYGLYSLWNSLGQNTGMGSLSLLQGIFPNPGIKPRSPTLWADSYQLSHKGSPRILEWVAFPFCGSSWPRLLTRVSCSAGGYFTNWPLREVLVAQVCPTLCNPIQTVEFSRQNAGVGSCSLLQGIFPTQGSNPGLLHCRRILYQLSHTV